MFPLGHRSLFIPVTAQPQPQARSSTRPKKYDDTIVYGVPSQPWGRPILRFKTTIPSYWGASKKNNQLTQDMTTTYTVIGCGLVEVEYVGEVEFIVEVEVEYVVEMEYVVG